jgi:hypothetical protein
MTKRTLIKRKVIENIPASFFNVGGRVLVTVQDTDVDIYPDLATAEKMTTQFIKSYKDLIREANS